jgi:hypothetical protein
MADMSDVSGIFAVGNIHSWASSSRALAGSKATICEKSKIAGTAIN